MALTASLRMSRKDSAPRPKVRSMARPQPSWGMALSHETHDEESITSVSR